MLTDCVLRFLRRPMPAAIAAILAAGSVPAHAEPAPGAAKGVCIETNRIDHTQIRDSRTILFYMNGGKIWQNTLSSRCGTMTSQDGFSFKTSINKLCSNLEQIRVLRTGQVCLLGEFTPYTPPPPPDAPVK